MPSLAHCLDLHKDKSTPEEVKALRVESRALALKKKMPIKQATAKVVKGYRDEAQREYDKIEKVIRDHYGVPEKPVPIKDAIAEPKAVAKKADDAFLDMWDSQIDSRTKNALVNRGGWITKLGKTSPEGKEIIKSKWNDITGDVKAKLKELMKPWIKDVDVKPTKETWEASDLADRPDISAGRIQAKKQADGKYKLFFTGTRNEVFEGETFVSAPEARQFFKVQQVKAKEAVAKRGKVEAKKPTVKKVKEPIVKRVAGQRSNKEGVEFYNPFNVKTRNKIIEGKPSFAGVVRQSYRDGFFTQGYYAVKLPEEPKTKGALRTGEKAHDVKSVIPTEDTTDAYLIGEFKPNESEFTFVHAMAPGTQDCFFNADYVDIILTKYPDARLSIGQPVYEGRTGIFSVGEDVVGIVSSVNVDISAFLEKMQQIKAKADVKFSVAEGEKKDLVAYHNLTGQNLIDADSLGGMPMPSLAITKKDFSYEPFGDITMVGSEGMVDPEGTFSRVFDADTYSPTVPGKERDLIGKRFSELWNRLSGKISDVGDYSYSLEEAAEKGYDQLFHFFDNSSGMKVAFLREQGIPVRIPMRGIGFLMPFSDTEAVQNFVKEYKGKISDIGLHTPEHKALSVAVEKGINEAIDRDYKDAAGVRKDVMDTWFDEEGYATWGLTVQRLEQDAKLILKPKKEIDKAVLRESLEKKFTKKVTADYLEWTKKQIDPLYGDPYLKLGKKKVPYTLDNVFEAMHRQNIKSSQDMMTFGPGKARAMGAKEFATLATARKHKAALVSSEKFEELKEEQDKKRDSLTDDLASYYQYKNWRGEVDIWNSIDDAMKAIGSFLKGPVKRQTSGQMRSYLSGRGFKNVGAETVKDAVRFAETLRDMPTEYFEVKPERVVSIGEFSGAALPKNVDPAVKEILKKHGVPFKTYKTEEERQAVTASFQRKKGVLFSEQPLMYSALTRAAESPKFPAKLPAKSIINQLKKASGVKQVEIDVSGLAEWLEGKEKVTKAELVNFLKMNEVRVEEVEKGEGRVAQITSEEHAKLNELLKDADNLGLEHVDAARTAIMANRDWVSRYGIENNVELVELGNKWRKQIDESYSYETKFAEHVLPGGEPGTYRELVLRVPGKKKEIPPKILLAETKRIAGLAGEEWETLGPNGRQGYENQARIDLEKSVEYGYRSPHWDEPNVVAHIRGDTRIGPDGKRRFHVAEFQSDIYSRIVELEAIIQERKIDESPEIKKRISELNEKVSNYKASTEEQIELNGLLEKSVTNEQGELANLKKLFPWGEMWHELVAKKALEYAVRNDFDGISWDTAKTQVDRWESALRKSVDRIVWTKGYSGPKRCSSQFVDIQGYKDRKGTFNERVLVHGETTIEGQRVTLNNLIGKELATKIRESSENSGSFEGEDLTIGGEFYKILYDQRIPGFLKKYGKKWGAKVKKDQLRAGGYRIDETGRGRFRIVRGDGYVLEDSTGDQLLFNTEKEAIDYVSDREFETVHSMDITSDMKEAIQTSGQALFAERAAPGKKLTVDTARAEIAERIGKKALDAMIRAKKVQLVTLNEAADIIGYARESKDQGFFKDGIVYIIPENIAVGHAWGVLMHELGVHLGYNKIFGEKLAKEVFAAFVANNGKMTPLGRAVSEAMRRVKSGTRPDIINEEAVAYFCEENANIDLPLHRKIIARMRLWAVKYFNVKPDIFVIEDYVALAASAMRGEIKEARRAPVREGVSREAFYSEQDIKGELQNLDAKLRGNKVILYRGGNVSKEKLKKLRYNDYLSLVKEGKDATGNEGAAGYGKNVIRIEVPISDIKITNGEIQYVGKAESLEGGKKYPIEIYRAYNDYYGSNYTASEIDKETNVRGVASKALEGGREEFDALLAKFRKGVFDIRYSVAEQKDLRSWADDLIKSAKDDSFVLDTQKTSPEEIRKSSMSILAGLNMKELNQPARSFLQGMSPKGKGLGATIEKWLASPEWYQHPVLKKIIGHALDKSEKFHTTFNEFNAVDDPMAKHDTVAKTLEALARKGGISKAAFILGRTSNDFKKLETLLDDADVYGEKHTTEGLKKKGYSEDVVQAWSVVRESYDKQLEALVKPMRDLVARIKEQAALMGTEPIYPDFGDFIIDGKKRRLTLQEAVMEMGRYRGTYSPRIRERGAWVVTGVIKKTVAEGGTEYFRNNRKTKSFANLLRDDLEKQGYTNVKVEKESKLPEETFQAVRMAEMGTMIGHAASKGLDKYDGEMQMAFMDEVVTASADMIKSRGARATMIRRREGLAVKGYITNPLTRFVRYTGTNAAGIAKAEMAERMIKDLYGTYVDGEKVGGIDAAKEGEIHSLARAYIEEQLRNAEAGDRIVGVMKGLTTLKFLGFNPRSILVNISSLATSVPMSLHTYILDGKGSLLRIGKVLSRSCKDYTMVMAGKRLKNTDEQIFIDAFRDAGYTDAQYTRDAMGNIQGAYGTAWSKLMGGSMYAFGKSEEWVRGGTALAAYRLARKKGLSHTETNEKAIFATSKAHGIYGKETLPMVAWGKGVGRLGQAFYTYMKFPHNYLQMLYDSGIRKKNIKGVVFGLAAPAVLGGVAAVPMYSTVMAIANMLMSLIGDDRDAEKLVYDTINEHMGKAGEETIRGGILGLVDVDISGSLSMGPGAIPTSLFELTGAVGGMVEDIGMGAKFAIEGEYGRAAEKLLPKALGNVFTAIREIEGATTGRGDRVWDEQGNPYMPAPSETAKKALGFRSARRALLAQSTWVAKREERRFKETQSDIYKKIKYMTAGSESIIINKETADKISEYNKNVLKTSNVPLITPASIERQMERMKAPTTKQKARVTGAERVERLEGDIWADALGVADRPDRIQTEVKRLSDLHMLSYSADPSRKINAGHGVEVTLDDDQYSRYVTDTSTMISELVDLIMARPDWSKLSDKRKAFAIKRMINKGRKIVRDRLKKTILKARLERGK